MHVDHQLLAFISLITILTITPAATITLVMRSAVLHGHRTSFFVILGGSIGVYVHAAFSALGLSLVLVKSAAVFQTIKLLGAFYIVFLGCRSLWRAVHSK